VIDEASGLEIVRNKNKDRPDAASTKFINRGGGKVEGRRDRTRVQYIVPTKREWKQPMEKTLVLS